MLVCNKQNKAKHIKSVLIYVFMRRLGDKRNQSTQALTQRLNYQYSFNFNLFSFTQKHSAETLFF